MLQMKLDVVNLLRRGRYHKIMTSRAKCGWGSISVPLMVELA